MTPLELFFVYIFQTFFLGDSASSLSIKVLGLKRVFEGSSKYIIIAPRKAGGGVLMQVEK